MYTRAVLQPGRAVAPDRTEALINGRAFFDAVTEVRFIETDGDRAAV